MNVDQEQAIREQERAFPNGDAWQPGTSLRDWFAGMALQGMLVNGFQPSMLSQTHHGNTADFDYTKAAFTLADYMLIERAKRK